MRNETVGKSHSKIILMGEHSVVYGQPAIALPISSVSLTAQVQPQRMDRTIQSKYFIGSIAKAPSNLLGVKRLIQAILIKFRQAKATFSMQIESTIPSERGMGSSAAVAIAITRALYRYFNQPLDHQKLLKVSNIEEKITHGNPSGIDTAAASSNQPVWFVPGHQIQSAPLNLTGWLIIADSGIKGRTDIAVNSVRQEIINHPEFAKPLIQKLGKLTKDTKIGLANNQIIKVGQDMDSAQRCLAKLGVSSMALDKLVNIAKDSGAYGAKLTGSGLGGCIIALAKSKVQAIGISNALLNIGAVNTWLQPLGNQGVQK